MFSIEGTCDWCKQPALLMRHDYIDGKHHYSCRKCHDYARLDVRQFNLAELASQQRASSRLTSANK